MNNVCNANRTGAQTRNYALWPNIHTEKPMQSTLVSVYDVVHWPFSRGKCILQFHVVS